MGGNCLGQLPTVSFFLHKNVCCWGEWFCSESSFPGAGSDPQTSFKLEAALCFTFPFSAPAFLLSLPLCIIHFFLLYLN